MTYDEKENLVRDRIKRLQSEKGFTENGLAAGDQPTQKRLNRQLSHGAAITLDTMLRILDACPEISADWRFRRHLYSKRRRQYWQSNRGRKSNRQKCYDNRPAVGHVVGRLRARSPCRKG